MNLINRILMVCTVAIASFLAGCATVPTPINEAVITPAEYIFSQEVESSSGVSKIIIVRDKTNPGIGNSRWIVRIDGKKIVAIGKGEVYTSYIMSGEHIMSVEPDSLVKVVQIQNLDQNLKEYNSYYYRAMFNGEHYVLQRFSPNFQDDR